MKRIALIGSTGSIGESTLSVVRLHPGRFRITALAAKNNIERLVRQVEEFTPEIVCVYEPEKVVPFKHLLGTRNVRIVSGDEGLNEVAAYAQADFVLSGVVGARGLAPIFSAIRAGKDIGIANKEPLVMAGALIIAEAHAAGVRVFPIDSEHSAIWQCLAGVAEAGHKSIRRLVLTASGGPFLGWSADALKAVTPAAAIQHPRWSMGKKISVDSATLMNKGFEVKEALHFFDVALDQIDVLIHPEAVIHSMVEFIDGSHLAQLAVNDMRIPIQYALSYPERLTLDMPRLDFEQIQKLTFQKPDRKTFRCLDLAYAACRAGGTAPAVLNAANEAAVAQFLDGALGFLEIAEVVEKALATHRRIHEPSLEDILEADRWAREVVYSLC